MLSADRSTQFMHNIMHAARQISGDICKGPTRHARFGKNIVVKVAIPQMAKTINPKATKPSQRLPRALNKARNFAQRQLNIMRGNRPHGAIGQRNRFAHRPKLLPLPS